MANVFSVDPNCKALWRFESGALTSDSIGTNTLTDNNTVGTDTSVYKEGAASARFIAANTEYFNITDSNLNPGFPLKTGDTTKVIGGSCWVRFDSLPTGSDGSGTEKMAVWCKWNSGAANERTIACWLYNNNGTSNCFFQLGLGYNSGASFEACNHGYNSIAINTWYHITISYDNSDKSWSVRLRDSSGNTLGTDATGTATLDANKISLEDTDFLIGNQFYDTSTNTYLLDGRVDELVIFNRVLSATDATNIAQGNFGNESWNQHSFRFVNDDGSESASTFKANLNTNVNLSAGGNVRIRFLLDVTNDPFAKSFQIEYRRKPSGGSFGSWKKVV